MEILAYVMFALGVAGRVFIPYLIVYLESDAAFDWRYVVAQVVAAFVALLPMLATNAPEWLGQVGALGALASFVYGWFAADIGREVQRGMGAAASFER
jgi:hypothetical protein